MKDAEVAAKFLKLMPPGPGYAEEILRWAETDMEMATLVYAYVSEPNNITARSCLVFLMGGRWGELAVKAVKPVKP